MGEVFIIAYNLEEVPMQSAMLSLGLVSHCSFHFSSLFLVCIVLIKYDFHPLLFNYYVASFFHFSCFDTVSSAHMYKLFLIIYNDL